MRRVAGSRVAGAAAVVAVAALLLAGCGSGDGPGSGSGATSAPSTSGPGTPELPTTGSPSTPGPGGASSPPGSITTPSASPDAKGRVLPEPAVDEEFGRVLTTLLRAGIRGLEPGALPATGPDPCFAVQVLGARLERGDVDLELLNTAGAECGDGAATFYRIRDRGVVESASVCWECEGPNQGAELAAYEKATEGYPLRGAELLVLDANGVLVPSLSQKQSSS